MSKSDLLSKLKKSSTIKHSYLLSESPFFEEKDMIPTNIPALNIALSARVVGGGLSPGITMFAGESKRFKSLFSLLLVKAYFKKYPDAVCIFYDSEFGTPKSYFESLKLPKDQIIHTPITNIEELKIDVMKQLEAVERNERVIFVLDSLGNLASKKEVEDALAEKTVQDMSRAKAIKSLFRMISPLFNLKNIPMIVVNHVYKEQGTMYPKDVVSGGTGPTYNSDNVYIIGRQQDKDGTEVIGYNFIINVEKSRFVKEKSKIPISVSYEGGVSKWSGLMEIALELGFCKKPMNGWYSKVDTSTGEIEEKKYRLKDTHTADFWNPIIDDPKFQEAVYNYYGVSSSNLVTEECLETDE